MKDIIREVGMNLGRFGSLTELFLIIEFPSLNQTDGKFNYHT